MARGEVTPLPEHWCDVRRSSSPWRIFGRSCALVLASGSAGCALSCKLYADTRLQQYTPLGPHDGPVA